ncbi:hypothetical protein KACC15558_19810 [Brevibacterium ammoniilyticum]|uniref:DUF2218 domain-containing protein n=2 Tax=Brevibacterium ammoniilyticum TaxID=1046555 RepID=A0ABP9U7S4_9MICO
MERIVQPAIDRILREGELDRLDLVEEPRGRNFLLVRVTACGEEFELALHVPLAGAEEEIADMAERFFSDLQDFVAESSFAWGELRGE